MSLHRQLAAFLATACLLAAPSVRAEPIHYAFHMLVEAGDGGSSSSSATPPASPELEGITGPPTAVALPDLLVLAVRQAPALQQARIDVEIADAQVEAARGIDDWSTTDSLSASHSVNSRLDNPGTFATTIDTDLEAHANLSRVFGWGSTLSIDGSAQFTRSNPLLDRLPVIDQYLDSVTATYVEPILRGRGSAVVRADQARARIARASAVLAKTQAANQVVRDVVLAYWDLVQAERDLEIRRSSLDLANERLRRTQAGIKGGGLARTEALEVEQVVATREEDVLASELALIDQSIALRRLVGMEIGPKQLALTTGTDLGVPDTTWDLDQLVEDAYSWSPELALLTEQGKDASIEVEVTENGVLPALDLSLTAGPVGLDDDPASAARKMVTVDNYVASATLTYTASLGNHAATGAARQARAQRQKIRIDETDTKAQIAESLTEAVLLAETATRRVDIAGRAIDLAEQNIVAEQARYSLGKSTNFDVLQRQDELKQAQLRQSRAMIDWHKAATVIASITGNLLTDYGITLDEK